MTFVRAKVNGSLIERSTWLGCEVDHPSMPYCRNSSRIASKSQIDVAPDESGVVRPLLDVSQVGEVARIGQQSRLTIR